MIHISTFSGIGGFELAAEWAGWKNVASCEINPFGQRVLKYYWPDAYHHDDVKTLTYELLNKKLIQRFGAEWRNDDIILTGGFPCQDISAANFKAEGIKGKRSGLWSEYARVISEINPKYVVIENSPLLLKRGFEKVLSDLSRIGYNAEWECISASAFGFPHRRKRLFIVAYSNGQRQQGQGNIFENISYNQESRDWQTNRVINAIQRKSLPPLCESNYGLSGELSGITVSNWRKYALTALGNSIVPQVAYQIFKAINEFNQLQP